MYQSQRQSFFPVIVALFISWVIIIGGVWRVFFRDHSPSETTDTSQEVQYYIGEQVLLAWTIGLSENTTQYSHILTDEDGVQFGLQSSEIVLNNYTGIVQIRGKVTEYRQKMPIVEVLSIVMGDEESDTEGTDSSWSTTTYTYFESYGFGIDLSNYPGFAIETTPDDTYTLLNDLGDTVLTIAPFVCEAWSATNDCSVLENLIRQSESFTTADRVTFSQLPETEIWVWFADDAYGYRLSAPKESLLQTYASTLSLVTPASFASRQDEARVLCRDLDSRMITVERQETSIDRNGIVTMTLEGSSDLDQSARCVVTTKLPDARSFVLDAYEGGQAPEETDTDTDDTSTTTDTDTDDARPRDTAVERPVDLENRKAYPSVRWWTMWVSRDVVSFEGVLLTGDQQPWCPYRIDMRYRSNTEESSADAYVYECFESGMEALEQEGYSAVWATGDIVFLMKRLTDAIDSADVYFE